MLSGRFTGQLAVSDPLQTVFQLLSGRIPTAATVEAPPTSAHLPSAASCSDSLNPLTFCSQCCGNDKYGDWRPHLAAMLSNQAGVPEVQQKAVVTMGDTLGTGTHATH